MIAQKLRRADRIIGAGSIVTAFALPGLEWLLTGSADVVGLSIPMLLFGSLLLVGAPPDRGA